MWPNAKICVMGPDQLSSVMQTVSGKNKPAPAVEGEDRWKELRSKIEAQSEATYSTARIWVSLSPNFTSHHVIMTIAAQPTPFFLRFFYFSLSMKSD